MLSFPDWLTFLYPSKTDLPACIVFLCIHSNYLFFFVLHASRVTEEKEKKRQRIIELTWIDCVLFSIFKQFCLEILVVFYFASCELKRIVLFSSERKFFVLDILKIVSVSLQTFTDLAKNCFFNSVNFEIMYYNAPLCRQDKSLFFLLFFFHLTLFQEFMDYCDRFWPCVPISRSYSVPLPFWNRWHSFCIKFKNHPVFTAA